MTSVRSCTSTVPSPLTELTDGDFGEGQVARIQSAPHEWLASPPNASQRSGHSSAWRADQADAAEWALLVEPIDAGAFSQSRAKKNHAWWVRLIGRLPGSVATVYGKVEWCEGEPPPADRSEYRVDATKPFEPDQLERCWTFAVGSWLARAFPSRFRHGAAGWDWAHVAKDAAGQPLGKSV